MTTTTERSAHVETIPTMPRRKASPRRQWLVYLTLFVTAGLMLLPGIWAVSTSLKRPEDVFSPGSGLIPNPITFDAYRDVFTLIPFGTYLTNSVVVTVVVVVLNVIFDSCAAYVFAKLPFPGRSITFGLLLMTLMIPMQVNLIPLYRMMVWVHGIFPALGADTLSGIIAPSAVQVFGIFLMRQFLPVDPGQHARGSTARWGR